MKKIVIISCILIVHGVKGQINVFDCGSFLETVTQSAINATPTYFGNCILFNETINYDFSSNQNREVLAAKSIQIKKGFHAGGYTDNSNMHLAISEKSALNVVAMDYTDLYSILRYKKFELGVELPDEILSRVNHFLLDEGTYSDELNPFLEWDVDLEAVFELINPGGWYEKVDGYYHREYVQDININDWIDVGTSFPMRIRYAPPKNGKWNCHVNLKINGVIAYTSSVFSFNVIESNDPGYVYVHPNKKNLMRGDRMIYPVGHNFVLEDEVETYTVSPNNTEKAAKVNAWNIYMNRLENYFISGGRYIRTIQRPQDNLIEFEKLGNYYDRLHYAWQTDKLMDLCETYDALILFNLLIQEPMMKYANYGFNIWDWDHFQEDGTYNANDNYGVYCYNTNPGVKKSYEMFTNENDLNFHKQRTRYYIARYGYSTKIYEFEILSEPWHVYESWVNGQSNQGDEAPFLTPTNPDHQIARNAVLNYHDEISKYIKQKQFNILVGMDMANGRAGQYGGYDQSITLPNIDVVGINPYYIGPGFLITSSTNVFAEQVSQIRYLSQSPVLISEGGTREDYQTCSNWTQYPVDMMTLGFTGIAGFNSWNGFRDSETHLWSKTVRAQNHMNGNDVINTLSNGYGDWSHKWQIENVSNSDQKETKELQYYISKNLESAVGYIRNRSFNVHTKRENSNCFISPEPEQPLNYLFNINWNDGPNSNLLWVKGLKSNTDYQIDWYSYSDGFYLGSDCQNTNGNKFKLKYPSLLTTFASNPVVWFVLKQQNCQSGIVVSEENFEIKKMLIEINVENKLEVAEKIKSNPRVYPNPVKESFIIESFERDIVRMVSIEGVLISESEVVKGINTINTSRMACGIYTLQFLNQNVQIKLVKL